MARKVLLVAGVLSSLLYVIGIDVIAAFRYPDYHRYADQMVSELLAVGAPTRTLMVWLCIPYNSLVFVLAGGRVGIRWGETRHTLHSGSVAGYGVVSTAGLLLFPMDVRGTVASQRDTLHIIDTLVMSIFIVAMMAFGAFAHGTRFRLYSLATIVTVVVFGAWAGFLARPMPGPTPWIGLAERINIYTTMLWVAVLGSLPPAPPRPAAPRADRDQCSRLAACLFGNVCVRSVGRGMEPAKPLAPPSWYRRAPSRSRARIKLPDPQRRSSRSALGWLVLHSTRNRSASISSAQTYRVPATH